MSRLTERQRDCLRMFANGPIKYNDKSLVPFCEPIAPHSNYDILGACFRDGFVEWERPFVSGLVELTPAGRSALAQSEGEL